jgi:uncharacterized protein (DUF2267 family)
MSTAGLEVFDKTLQTTNTWLQDIMHDHGPDRQVAWRILGVVLRALRDRLPIETSVHLGAQLPLLVRGTYYEQWHLTRHPAHSRDVDAFLKEIATHLSDLRPINPEKAAQSVFRVLMRHIDRGQVDKVRIALPSHMRDLWPEQAPGG